MIKSALLVAIMLATSPLRAQDIVGLEDCAQARGPDKKIGCLQANVEFLHRLIRKNDATAQAKLREEAAKVQAATARLDALHDELSHLKAAFDQLESRLPKK